MPTKNNEDLCTISDSLIENPKLVSDPVAISRYGQGGHGVKEAGCQPSQASIAQTCILFTRLKLFHVQTHLASQTIDSYINITLCEKSFRA